MRERDTRTKENKMTAFTDKMNRINQVCDNPTMDDTDTAIWERMTDTEIEEHAELARKMGMYDYAS